LLIAGTGGTARWMGLPSVGCDAAYILVVQRCCFRVHRCLMLKLTSLRRILIFILRLDFDLSL